LKKEIMKKNTSINYPIFISYIVGALLGLTLTVLATWADLESVHYAYDFRASASFSGMKCPILMTANETNSFSAKITNTTDKLLSFSIKTEISSRRLPVPSVEYIELDPGQSKTLQWTMGPENIDLGNFIFAKALVYGSYPIPNRESTCGVFILDLPTSGTVITWTMVILSLLGMGVGLYRLNQIQSSAQNGWEITRRLTFLSVVVIAGLIASFMGWWILGVLIIVITLLFIVISLGFFINRGRT
jgi:hypothetical protein